MAVFWLVKTTTGEFAQVGAQAGVAIGYAEPSANDIAVGNWSGRGK
jgi:hypothetical protein